MSENPFTDGQQFSAARLNSMYNAHQNEGVLNGCDGSASANNFDVDISSGQIIIGDNIVDVAATTVSHSTSDPEDRIDLITANSNGTVSITQGNPAATAGQPVAPDIPTNEILLVLVYLRGGSSEILTGDIFNDYKTEVLNDGVPSGIITMWGGSIADIPDGWTLCDGTDGTPDLQDRFVVGGGNQYSVDDAGGADSVQLTLDQMPSHAHEVRDDDPGAPDGSDPTGGEWIKGYEFNSRSSGGSAENVPLYTGSLLGHDALTSKGGDQSHENRPPYYALAYIQKL